MIKSFYDSLEDCSQKHNCNLKSSVAKRIYQKFNKISSLHYFIKVFFKIDSNLPEMVLINLRWLCSFHAEFTTWYISRSIATHFFIFVTV